MLTYMKVLLYDTRCFVEELQEPNQLFDLSMGHKGMSCRESLKNTHFI